MTEITDALREGKRLRLLATALELLHCERTDRAVIDIPGTEPPQFVAIGTAATIGKLLEIDESQRKLIERAIIGLRDGWASRADANEALAALSAPAGAKCWACERPYTDQQRADADGHCPHCGAEIELDDEPSEREQLIACLGDDAAKLAAANPDDEMAQTMREAAAMLERDGAQEGGAA